MSLKAPATSAKPPSLWFGVLFLAIGGFIMAGGAGLFPSTLKGANAPLWVILAAGATFALAGASFFAQRWLPKALAEMLPCLILTLFAAMPAWVAWGEGPRQFSMSLSGFGFALWWDTVSVGRIAFGFAAVVTGAIAIVVWIVWWRRLPGWGRVAFFPLAAVAGWLLFVVVPAEPRWGGLADDHERLRRYGEIGEREGWLRHARSGRPIDWAYPPWRNLDAWSKAARSRLAAQREAPVGAAVHAVPIHAPAPTIDGVFAADEWQGALILPMTEGDGRATVRLLSDGVRLFLAGEAPADTTAAGYDQFRFWFHLHLSPAMPYERAFLRGSGGDVNVMRSVVFPWGGKPEFQRTDWYTHGLARGASTVDGYRRYEMVLDLAEAGLHRGVAFPAFFDIEGDPEKHPDGKFKARTTVGRAGNLQEPIWLRIAG
jgi:hypothetical protein